MSLRCTGGFKNPTCSILFAERLPPLANEANVNTCLRSHQRPNNRSGVFLVLHSTSNIGSCPPGSSCSHNDWKQWKGIFWHREIDYWSGKYFLGYARKSSYTLWSWPLGLIHTAGRAEPNRASGYSHCRPSRADPNWKQCSWHFWTARMSNQVHVFSLMDNIWWTSLLFTRKRRFWVHNISSRRESFSEFHNLLD